MFYGLLTSAPPSLSRTFLPNGQPHHKALRSPAVRANANVRTLNAEHVTRLAPENYQPTHEYESSGGFPQPQVFQPILLILGFPRNSLHFGLVLRRTEGRGEDVHRGAGARAGRGVLREKRLGCEGLQRLLPLLVGLGKKEKWVETSVSGRGHTRADG